jgi:hypothetical protein
MRCPRCRLPGRRGAQEGAPLKSALSFELRRPAWVLDHRCKYTHRDLFARPGPSEDVSVELTTIDTAGSIVPRLACYRLPVDVTGVRIDPRAGFTAEAAGRTLAQQLLGQKRQRRRTTDGPCHPDRAPAQRRPARRGRLPLRTRLSAAGPGRRQQGRGHHDGVTGSGSPRRTADDGRDAQNRGHRRPAGTGVGANVNSSSASGSAACSARRAGAGSPFARSR